MSPGCAKYRRGLVRLGLAMLGRDQTWDQLDGQLVVDPSKLIDAGWRRDPGHGRRASSLWRSPNEARLTPTDLASIP
jgi:hypothetical protein